MSTKSKKASKKARTPAQKAATARMIAANKRGKKASKKPAPLADRVGKLETTVARHGREIKDLRVDVDAHTEALDFCVGQLNRLAMPRQPSGGARTQVMQMPGR